MSQSQSPTPVCVSPTRRPSCGGRQGSPSLVTGTASPPRSLKRHPPPGSGGPPMVLVVVVVVGSLCAQGSGGAPGMQMNRGVSPEILMTPPLGWNSYNRFGCNISEIIVRETADALVSSGLAALGYQYVNVDDCWSDPSRDSKGRLVSDPRTFPSGMKALGDYIHSLGLKFGLYADAGVQTCLFRAGSLGHEILDAATFADWGVDYVKYDNCYPDQYNILPFQRFRSMGLALRTSGRRIVFSMCQWGQMFPALWARHWGLADLWRTTTDISPSWDSVMRISGENNFWASWAGPGGWNDPDVLEVGNGVLSESEERTHFSLWVIMKAPLILGMDVRNMSEGTRRIVTNKDALGINQDVMGVQARRVTSLSDLDVWCGPLSGGREVVALVNRGNSTSVTGSVDLVRDLGLPWGSLPHLRRNVWMGENKWFRTSLLEYRVGPHDVTLLILTPRSMLP